MRNASQAVNVAANSNLTVAGLPPALEWLEWLVIHQDPVLGYSSLVLGALFKYLHYRLEKNRESKS